MKYKCIHIRNTAEKTQRLLNRLAENGWRVVCAYADLNFLILEKGERR